MYKEIISEVNREFRLFSGKPVDNFEPSSVKQLAVSSKELKTSLPRHLHSGSQDQEMEEYHDKSFLSNISRHDESTRSLFEGYFHVIQRYIEDLLYPNKEEVHVLSEFYQFEKSHHSMNSEFLEIWEILDMIFDKIDYGTVLDFEDDKEGLQNKLARNTCTFLENEFSKELGIDQIVMHYTKDNMDDGIAIDLPEEAIDTMIEYILDYIKSSEFETSGVQLEKHQDIPIYGVVYFLLRAGHKNIAEKVAKKYELSIYRLFESAEQPVDIDYKTDIFKEAIYILTTKKSIDPNTVL